MQFPSVTAVDFFVISLSLYLLVVLRDHRKRRGLPYPPGPQSWPIIGNLLDVPSQRPWIAYTKMSKRYGEIVGLHVLGQLVVVLSSSSAIKDLLERRGELYSDRPSFPLHEVLGVDWLLPALSKGDVWSEGRKLLDRSLRPAAPISYRNMMEEKTRSFLGQLFLTPKHFRSHIELLQGKLIMSLTYGYDLKTYDDDLIVAPVELNKVLAESVLPGAVLMNHIPFIKHIHSWIPFLSQEAVAQKCRRLSETMKTGPIDFVWTSMREGTAAQSLASEHLRDVEHLSGPERQKQERVVQEALGSLFNGEPSLSVASLMTLFLALTLYPEVQKRAQAELDSVIGRDRLPTFDDRPQLPYIDAMCKEVLRWRPALPLGFPHASTQDGVYKDFFIPKGATIIANAWGVLHDPELYPDPSTFNPERFLSAPAAPPPRGGGGGGGQPRLNDPQLISLAFGAGKRICPGRHFVDASLFILAASVLAVFSLSKPTGVPEEDPISGIGIGTGTGTGTGSGAIEAQEVQAPGKAGSSCESPGEFGCVITPRDALAKDLIAAHVTTG
ncbi:cytochrome P450 [Russula dissimulans]|nr:cytochrome P450 [Russula dissimulans]